MLLNRLILQKIGYVFNLYHNMKIFIYMSKSCKTSISLSINTKSVNGKKYGQKSL